MRQADDGSTSPTLLSAVADRANHPAWVRFRDTYDSRLRRRCLRFGLDAEAIDEVCQRIWIELAERMRTFEYDASRSFRGWLGRLCDSRALDFLRERRAHPSFRLDDRDGGGAGWWRAASDPAGPDEGEGDDDPLRAALLAEAERVQSAVRARVKPHNWEAFWLVAVRDWGVERTARALGMTKVAVYAARERVARMLREEGRRVSDRGEAGG